MANNTADDHDISSPANDAIADLTPAEIRVLREFVASRLNKEHTTIAGSGAGGEHKPGSAIVYWQSGAPTLRPDGSTPLGVSDVGRLWIDTDTGDLWTWNGTAWVLVKAGAITDGVVVLADLADNSVSQVKLTDDSVGTAEIVNENVTYLKLAQNIRMRYFTYTGNGSSSGPVIGGIGVLNNIKAILIMGSLTNPGIWYGTVGNTTAYFADGSDSVASALQWNVANVTITTSSIKINASGVVYTAIVIS